ncbi:MAG: septum site-determining protein MinD [Ruminococcaceae bacterium]|nr:septum site-determining protein MinD [Oscillospiraceae bacterium]
MKNIFLVASGKGGVGKSSVTAFLGRALVKLNKKVLLIDMDVALRSLDLILNTTEKCVYDWGDVLEERATVKQAVVKGENGNPDLLCAPVRFSPVLTEKGLEPIIDEIRDDYDFIFLDAPAGLGEMLSLGSAVADKALLVATPDEVCVRSAGVAADTIFSYGFKGEARLVINRYRKKESKRGRLLAADSVIDKTAVRLIGIVPEDNAVAFYSVTAGVLNERNPAYLAFMRIAKRLLGERIELKFTKL